MSDEPKRAVGDVLGNAGEPVQIPANGKVYKLAYPTPAAIDRVEKLLAASYVAEVSDLCAALPPAEADELRKGLRADLAARTHRAGGELWAKMLGSPNGATLYLLGLLRHHHPELTEADAAAIQAAAPVECEAAMELVSPFFFGLVALRLGRTPDQARAAMDGYAARVAEKKASTTSPS